MKKTVYILATSLLFLLPVMLPAQGWSELGGLNGLAANNIIWTICGDSLDNIYTAGFFTNNSGKYYVSKYNGNAWSELGGQNSMSINYSINAICSDLPGNIYAGGYFTYGLNFYVDKYNGTTWSPLGGFNGLGADSRIQAICSDKFGNIYTAGQFVNDSNNYYVAKYNGTTWSELGGLNGLAANGWIYALCSDALGNIYAAGFFTNSSGKYYVAKWNGTAWSELGGLNAFAANGPINTLCTDVSGNIYAAGGFTNAPGFQYVAKYNGTNWSELGGVNALRANETIESICSDTLGNIYAGGVFVNISSKCYVAKYNGATWSELGGLNSLAANNMIYSVYCDKPGNIYAAGRFTNDSGKRYVAKYTVPNGPPPLHISSVNSSPACGICSGSAGVNVINGYPPYNYYWYPGNFTTASIDSLCGGTYYITVTETSGASVTDSVTIHQYPKPVVTLSWDSMVAEGLLNIFFYYPDTVDCAYYNVPLIGGIPSGGTYTGHGIYQNILYGDSAFSYYGLDTITYTVSVNGCSASTLDELLISPCEGISQLSLEQSISLYPNPVNNMLIVHSVLFSSNNVAPVLYDITGKLIAVGFTRQHDEFVFNTSNLSPGIYFIKLNIGGNEAVKRFVKVE